MGKNSRERFNKIIRNFSSDYQGRKSTNQSKACTWLAMVIPRLIEWLINQSIVWLIDWLIASHPHRRITPLESFAGPCCASISEPRAAFCLSFLLISTCYYWQLVGIFCLIWECRSVTWSPRILWKKWSSGVNAGDEELKASATKWLRPTVDEWKNYYLIFAKTTQVSCSQFCTDAIDSQLQYVAMQTVVLPMWFLRDYSKLTR